MHFLIKNEKEIENLAEVFAKNIIPEFILLSGQLGAGKTTFTKYLAKSLKIQQNVNSPTFIIMNQYDLPNKNYQLIHIDAYRLTNESDDLEMFLEAFHNNLVIIEWYENIDKIINFNNAVILELKLVDDNIRDIKISGQGNLYNKIIKDLNNK